MREVVGKLWRRLRAPLRRGDSRTIAEKGQMLGATEAEDRSLCRINEDRSRPSNAADGPFRRWSGRGGLRRPRLKTHWGFPVAYGDDDTIPENRPARGIALIMAIIVVAVLVHGITDLIVTSSVNSALSATHADKIKADYAARSGMYLATFLIIADLAVDVELYPTRANPIPGMPPAGQDRMSDLWAKANSMPPIGESTMKLLGAAKEAFGLSAIGDAKAIEYLTKIPGSFKVDVEDEGGRINVNCNIGRCDIMLKMIEALLSCPAERAYLDARGAKLDVTPSLIKDYSDPGTDVEQGSGQSSEDDPYSGRTPRYRAKNAPFDSIDELLMVEGWGDEVHKIFAKHLTVFPFQEKREESPLININTMSCGLIWCLFPETRKDENREKFIKECSKSETQGYGEGEKIPDILSQKFFMTAPDSGGSESGGRQAGDRSKWFVQHSDVFRITVVAEVEDQKRTLQTIVRRKIPQPKESKEPRTNAGSYTRLTWKLQ